VERILLNLLDNALKYRAEDAPSIELALRVDTGRVLFVVSDNGPGITARDRKHIFEEFYRARFENYGVQGSGLGLAIAHRLAHALGGDLFVLSVEGKGSAFTLALPLPPPRAARPGSPALPKENSADAR